MKNANTGSGRTIFLNLILRITILIISCLVVIYLVTSVLGREMVFSLLVGCSLIIIQIKLLTDYVLKINRSLVKFIDSEGFTEESDMKFKKDNSQVSGFELRVNQLKEDIGRSKLEGQKQKFLLNYAIDEMEHGLICVRNNSDVIFSNKAFRSLIDDAEINMFTRNWGLLWLILIR